MALYPDDPRVADARQKITSLRAEEALGNYRIAQYYEKQKRWDGALVYYNEVLLTDAASPLANQARQRIDKLKKRGPAAATKQVSPTPWTPPATGTEPAVPAVPATPGK
jgi:predicted TPR repeat methyltransferase